MWRSGSASGQAVWAVRRNAWRSSTPHCWSSKTSRFEIGSGKFGQGFLERFDIALAGARGEHSSDAGTGIRAHQAVAFRLAARLVARQGIALHPARGGRTRNIHAGRQARRSLGRRFAGIADEPDARSAGPALARRTGSGSSRRPGAARLNGLARFGPPVKYLNPFVHPAG